MADDFKKALNKQIGPGGIKCPCCYPVNRKERKRVTRKARRIMKRQMVKVNQEVRYA